MATAQDYSNSLTRGQEAATDSQGAIAEINSRIRLQTDVIRDQALFLHRVADRLMGELGDSSKGSAPRPVRAGMVGNVRDAFDTLEEVSALLIAATKRIGEL